MQIKTDLRKHELYHRGSNPLQILPKHAATRRPASIRVAVRYAQDLSGHAAVRGQQLQSRLSVPRHRSMQVAASAVEGYLGKEAKQIKLIAWWSFWSQIALSVVSAVVLCFTIGTTGRPGAVPPASTLFTLFGVVTSFISTFIAYGLTRTTRKVLVMGQEIKRSTVEGSLLAANRLNFLGIGATLIGLQAAVGGLVAKTLTTSSSNPYAQAGRPVAPTSALDVFSVQACANTIFAHFVSLLFMNWLQRVLLKQPKGSVSPPPPQGLPGSESRGSPFSSPSGKPVEEDYTRRPGRKGPLGAY